MEKRVFYVYPFVLHWVYILVTALGVEDPILLHPCVLSVLPILLHPCVLLSVLVVELPMGLGGGGCPSGSCGAIWGGYSKANFPSSC